MGLKVNPNEDFVRPKVLLGYFPGHIVQVRAGTKITKNGIESYPYNIKGVLAPECAGIMGKDLLTGEELDGEISVGLTVESTGVWFTPEPPKKQGWRNEKYFNLYTAVMDPKPDKDGAIELDHLDEVDALGKPIMFQIGFSYDNRDRDLPVNERRKYIKITGFNKWQDGYEIDPTTIEEFPF